MISMTILGLLGCGFSSKELPGSLSELRVEVDLEQSTERREGIDAPFDFRQVSAVIRNAKGTLIENEAIGIRVNGLPLRFRVSTGNYGEHHPWYSLDDEGLASIESEPDLRFTLLWSDGTEHEIGVIRAPGTITLDHFTLPERLQPGEETTISWRDLPAEGELLLYRNTSYRDEFGNWVLMPGSGNDPEALRKKIGPGFLRGRSGSLRISRAFLADRGNQKTCGVGVEIAITTRGAVSSAFHRASYLTAKRKVSLATEIEGTPNARGD
ncbi:MAG: hypothetical protein IT349_02695 [Candidatus Eisenbacteria bacterium]|nr:hypothetical protein [Candidatus Eisenbacteria bacterium]